MVLSTNSVTRKSSAHNSEMDELYLLLGQEACSDRKKLNYVLVGSTGRDKKYPL